MIKKHFKNNFILYDEYKDFNHFYSELCENNQK
jgi:hypothetical protein